MRRRTGFSLVEVVVVVMILGILAAVAVPKVMQASAQAEQKAVEQSAAVVRDAIDYYRAAHEGHLPGGAATSEAFKNDLAPYLRNFPFNRLMKSDDVRLETTGRPLAGAVGGTAGWLYDNRTGEFIANTQGNAGGMTPIEAPSQPGGVTAL